MVLFSFSFTMKKQVKLYNCNCYPLKKGLGEENLSLHPSSYLELTFGGISPSGDVGSIRL